MSAPLGGKQLSVGDLLETLRGIVLGVEPSTLPNVIMCALLKREWIEQSAGELRITRVGYQALAADGDKALEEILAWLESDEAKEFFRQ